MQNPENLRLLDSDGANRCQGVPLWGMQEARKKDGRDLFSRWLFLGLEEYFHGSLV